MSELKIKIRKADERGKAEHGWLHSRFSFSFSDYYDPDHMGFGPLRVINDDVIDAGRGFGMHPHKDMEIVSYVVEGELQHEDSMGNTSVIKPGDVQRMTAGTGVRHSEVNPSGQPTHLLQVWIEPHQKGLKPGYAQDHFSREAKKDQFRLLVSPDGREGSLSINQDADLYGTILSPGTSLIHPLPLHRQAWLQVVRGQLRLNGKPLLTGDGAAIEGGGDLRVEGVEEAEFILFDLA